MVHLNLDHFCIIEIEDFENTVLEILFPQEEHDESGWLIEGILNIDICHPLLECDIDVLYRDIAIFLLVRRKYGECK